MWRLTVVFLLIVSACSAEQELAPTTSVAPATTTSTTPATTTSITAPVTTITTLAPTTTTTLTPLQGLAYQEIARIDFPVQLVAVPGSEIGYVATKDGRVWAFDGETVGETVLDISARVRNKGEQGLLSIALHPDDPGRFFAHYSANDGDTVVSEFIFGDDGSLVDEQVLLCLDQPASNHNGGMIQFGPDGGLYVGLGDGGGANDRFGNGQNRDTLLGGLVRIDVDGSAEPELYQYGLRNPWRFWIDDETIYIADVGQNAFEEISVASLNPDVNYGWPITEGLHCLRPSSGCETEGLTLPVIELAHGDAGTCSITGGVVYRGPAIPELDGVFLFSDYCGGYLRGLSAGELVDYTGQVDVAGRVVGFGVDGLGEVYVMTTDRLLKLVPVRG